ncbi:hypothetical protein RP20_CCG024838 [Aedes albopictus]|nr:hypothetical protein RP20_CCG024838 [Aedes albopictus]
MSRSTSLVAALAVLIIHLSAEVSAKTFEDLLTELRSYKEPHEYCYNGPFKSCAEEPTKVSGPYELKPFPHSPSFGAYCEQKLFGGGWLVIQSRFDGSEDFFRNFSDYKRGFGKLTGEFWYGLEKIHKLTAWRNTQLLVELKSFKGETKYAKYDEFELGSEIEAYNLKKLGAYCGTAGDGLRYNHPMWFQTQDFTGRKEKGGKKGGHKDKNCAVERVGAWWYKDCSFSNLNGLYGDKDDPKYMNWYPFNNSDEGLCFSRMMIRGY